MMAIHDASQYHQPAAMMTDESGYHLDSNQPSAHSGAVQRSLALIDRQYGSLQDESRKGRCAILPQSGKGIHGKLAEHRRVIQAQRKHVIQARRKHGIQAQRKHGIQVLGTRDERQSMRHEAAHRRDGLAHDSQHDQLERMVRRDDHDGPHASGHRPLGEPQSHHDGPKVQYNTLTEREARPSRRYVFLGAD